VFECTVAEGIFFMMNDKSLQVQLMSMSEVDDFGWLKRNVFVS